MATTNKDSKPNDKKTMDVSKPGKATPDASSRPVIVTHKPMIQDPMVKSSDTPTDLPEKDDTPTSEKLTKTSNKVIQPLTTDEDNSKEAKSEESKPEDTQTKPDESVADEVKPDEDKVEETPTSDAAAEVDAVVDQAITDKKKDELSEEEKRKREELQKLIKSKKYFVPIGQVTKRRKSRHTLLMLIGLALLLVGIYALMDAEIIRVGFDVPFDFIKTN
jgi:hypothetical protein